MPTSTPSPAIRASNTFAPRLAPGTRISSFHLTHLMPCNSDRTPCAQFGRPPCGRPKTESLRTLDEIVRAYCRDYRKAAECEYAHWAKHNSLNGAIRAAALSDFPCGKRHPHQRRIPAAALRRAAHDVDQQGSTDRRHVSRSAPSCSRYNRLHTRHWRIDHLRHHLTELPRISASSPNSSTFTLALARAREPLASKAAPSTRKIYRERFRN